MMVGVLARPYDEDSDNEKLLESIAKQQAETVSSSTVAVFILLVDPSYPNPNAGWRRRFAEARDSSRFGKVLFAVVTPAPHLRGVLTAVNWIRPPSSRFEAETFATFDDAVGWIEAKRGQRLPTLKRLLDDVHGRLGHPTPARGRPRVAIRAGEPR